MILALDVHYRTSFAKAVSVEFADWQDAEPAQIHEAIITEVAPYVPGEFYKRELPCLLEVLQLTPLETVDCIVVDGFVILDDEGKYGLGGYLYEALEKNIPIIGVAKRSFKNNRRHVQEIYRGESQNPLYISALGMELQQAGDLIQRMTGKYRMPDLLRILDRRTKED